VVELAWPAMAGVGIRLFRFDRLAGDTRSQNGPPAHG